MNQELISVLVPVYNAGTWLQNCLESISGQTYKNLEIILVDDGSSDGSREICGRFCREDARFRLICQENRGVSAARNAALDAAQGQYVYFTDSDDYLSPRALEVLYDAIKSGPYDMATAGFKEVGDIRYIPSVPESAPCRVCSGEDCLRECVLCFDLRWRVVWNHLIPSSLVKDVRFEPMFQEDALFCYDLFRRLEQTIVVDETTYYYVLRPGSLSETPGYLSEKANFDVSKKMLALTPENEPLHRAWILKKTYRHLLIGRYRAENRGEKEDLLSSCRPFLRETRREYFSHPDISFGEKLMFSFLWACPWAMWLFMKVTRN